MEEALKDRKTRWFKDHLTPAGVAYAGVRLAQTGGFEAALDLTYALQLRKGSTSCWSARSSEKTKRGRYVPLLKETLATLLAWQEDQQLKGVWKVSSSFLIPLTGNPLGSVDTAWENLITEASRRCKSPSGTDRKGPAQHLRQQAGPERCAHIHRQ